MANQALKTVTLKDFLYSEGEACQNVDAREHVFEIRAEADSSFGYITLYDLKNYLIDHHDEVKDYQVRNIDSNEWIALFEHPYFQRRKPQLVSATTLSTDDEQQYFMLRNGQKTGPFEKYELTTMLEDKEILLTDMVSTNHGHTWMKLYQVDGFDRRSLKESDQLPGVPSHVLMQQQESVMAISPETEAISGLAYLSNVKRGKSFEREKIDTSFTADSKPGTSSSTIYKWLLVVSIVGIGYFLFHIKNQLSSPFSNKEAKSVGEQAEMLDPVNMNEPMPPQTNPSARSQLGERRQNNQVNDQGRSGKFETRNLNPIRPNQRKSFMESSKFQEINAGEDDPNYFYDNTSAMELDPVRSQVSKENYDNSGSEDGPIPSSDNLFESEVSN
nr:DUF4339 domain-containing protein [Bacteriovorax sp. HI3]